MSTFVLPKVSEFGAGLLARGSDVLANDSALTDFINGANLDQTNINQGMTPIWTGDHRFSSNILIDPTYKLQFGAVDNYILASGSDQISFFINGSQTLVLEETKTTFATDIDVQGHQIRLDVDGDSYFKSEANDFLSLYLGAILVNVWRPDGSLLLPDIASPEPNYGNRNSFAKAWGSYIDGSGLDASYNIDSVVDDAANGVYYINFATDFATNNYCITATNRNVDLTGSVKPLNASVDVISAAQAIVRLCKAKQDNVFEDGDFCFVAFGAQ